MLQIDKVQQIEGVTVYGDHEKINLYYLIPQSPRYRRYDDGRLAFNFMKYQFPVDRPDGKKGGAFLLFDVEFIVDPAKLPKIKETLTNQVTQEANRLGISPVPEVVFGTVTYTRGTTQLILAGSDGTFVEKISTPGKPSLFGNNISTVGVELSEMGATFFEEAMKTHGGSSIAMVYDLYLWARLPEIKVDGYFYASSFYSFYQTIDQDWDFWFEDSYRETIREQLIQSEAMALDFEWGGVTDEKVRAPIRDWAMQALEDAVERKMIEAVAPVPDDQRKAPDGIEDVTRDIMKTQISNVSIHYTESQTVEWNIAPQGQLQSLTDMTNPDGSPVKWEDYFHFIRLDDPFFKQLRVDTFVNADFTNLPIHSVEVKLNYNGRPMANLAPNEPDGEIILNSPDDVGKFATYVENDNWKYKYSYQVNYRGQSRIYQSPEIETDEGNLTIGVDNVGILAVNVSAGDLDWDEVTRALVIFRYSDDNVEPIEEQFWLFREQPSHKIMHVIFQPVRKKYKYRVRYSMKNKELESDEMEGSSPDLYINDVFGGRKTVAVRGTGDFASRIENVFVTLKYTDVKNDYSLTRNQALNSGTKSFDWVIPVISETGGKVSYSADVVYLPDHTTEHIPETVAEGDTILLPPPAEAILEVELVTALIDWPQMRLVRVSLSYHDPDGGPTVSKDYTFAQQPSTPVKWKVELKNKDHTEYTYTVTYYLVSKLQRTVGPKTSTDTALILDPDEKDTEAIVVRPLESFTRPLIKQELFPQEMVEEHIGRRMLHITGEG